MMISYSFNNYQEKFKNKIDSTITMLSVWKYLWLWVPLMIQKNIIDSYLKYIFSFIHKVKSPENEKEELKRDTITYTEDEPDPVTVDKPGKADLF